jgi:hypothetical protein
MANVSIGNHSKIIARHSDQERIRSFYRGVLGCVFTKESEDVDYIRFHEGYFQAPGGQVFRLVRTGEDLSRFEK